MSLLNNSKLIILLCWTLGLAPYFPEPHLLGKIKWIMGGDEGMKAMDYFDFVFYGLPIILLIRFGFNAKNKS